MVKVQADSVHGEDGVFSLCPCLEEGAGGSLDLFHQDADPSWGPLLHGFVTRGSTPDTIPLWLEVYS